MKPFDKVKEFVGSMSAKGKKRAAVIGCGLIIFSVIIATVLNHKDYTVLFSGLNEEESTEVMAKLQESGVEYQYNQNGSIMVPRDLADKTRAAMAMDGYPKSGLNYDVFTNNSGLMSTESDKETYKIYDLQNRIGATVRAFDGVKSAVVTISPGETQKYVLDNNALIKPSAYVMVTMQNGGSPTEEQVTGIQRLVATSVPNMDMGDVAVIDGNGVDVSVVRSDNGTSAAANNKKTEYEQKVEQQVQQKVLNVLEPLYGRNNVKVSVKCTADIKKIISEEIDYTAPDAQNNSGYISRESLMMENSGAGGAAAGVPGAQNNTNVPQYNTQAGDGNGYSSSSEDREYAINQKKVQEQNESGAIVDMSIAVTLNNKTAQEVTVERNDVINLVGRAAGMDPAEQNNKIAVVAADFYEYAVTAGGTAQTGGDGEDEEAWRKYLPLIIGGLAALFALLLVLLVVIGVRRKKKKKKRRQNEPAEEKSSTRVVVVQGEAPQQEDVNEEIITIKNERGVKLKNDIKSFAEDNPQISAGLLKSWLRGGDDSE